MRKKVLIVTASVVAGAAALMALGRYIKGPCCLFKDVEEEEEQEREDVQNRSVHRGNLHRRGKRGQGET